jgi:hypothetical protein
VEGPAFSENFQIQFIGLQWLPCRPLPEDRSAAHVGFRDNEGKLGRMTASYDKTSCVNTLFAKGIRDDCAKSIVSHNTGKIAPQIPSAEGDKSRCHRTSPLDNQVREFTFYIG